jgi:hypothetical protein
MDKKWVCGLLSIGVRVATSLLDSIRATFAGWGGRPKGEPAKVDDFKEIAQNNFEFCFLNFLELCFTHSVGVARV